MATKNTFIKKMAKKGGITQSEAEGMSNLFIETLLDCIREDGVMKFVGFGKFELKTIKGKAARNPRTGQLCTVPEHKKVKFYSSENLVDRIMS